MRAKNADEKIIEDFFAKLAAVLARLNLLSKPMLVYNADETGFTKVHKSRCKVLARRGQRAENSLGYHIWRKGKNPHCTRVWVCSWPCYSTTNHISKSSHTRQFEWEHLQAPSLPHLRKGGSIRIFFAVGLIFSWRMSLAQDPSF